MKNTIKSLLILTTLITSSHAVRFRDDNISNTLKISMSTATSKPHGNNAVCVNIENVLFSGWMVTPKTVLTTAHDLKTLSLDGAYVTNDFVVDTRNIHLNKYAIKEVIFHPDYIERPYSAKPFETTIETLSDPKFRIENAQFKLGLKPSFEFLGCDLALLHLNDIVPNTVPLDFYDPSLIQQNHQGTLYSYGRMALSNGTEISTSHTRHRHVGVSKINYIPELGFLYSAKQSMNGAANSFIYSQDEHALLAHTHFGDSGCGIVSTDPTDQKQKLIGINSRYTNVQIRGMIVPNFELFTPVYLHQEWIRDHSIG